MSLTRAGVALLMSGVLLSSTVAYAAPTKDHCASSNEDADALRKRGALKAARISLQACDVPECPKVVRDDCAARLAEVEAAIPTIVFDVKENGVPITDVKVGIDRTSLVEDRLDGKDVAVDPGEHVFTFQAKGWPILSRTLTIKEGEKGRHEVVIFGSATPIPTTGHLVITTEVGAAIAVDGQPPVAERFDGNLAPGAHSIKITKAKRETFQRTVDVRLGETNAMNVPLKEEKSSLTPWLIGGGAVVVVGLIVGGIVLATSSK